MAASAWRPFREIDQPARTRCTARRGSDHSNTRAAVSVGGDAMRLMPKCRRQRCFFQTIEQVADGTTKTPFDPAGRRPEGIKQQAHQHGLSVYSIGGTIHGENGDFVVVIPPGTAKIAGIDLIAERPGAATVAVLT